MPETFLEWLLLILAIFGGIDLGARGLGVLVNAFPRLLSLQRAAWRLLADGVAVPALRRKALSSRIEEVVNQSAFQLQQCLPKGWVRRARIRWVRSPKAAQLRDGDIVVRIRPAKDLDQSLMRALWTYFEASLFPDSRDLVPREVVSASALAVTRASLERNHRYLLKEFDENFLRSVVSEDATLAATFADCVRLNDYGLLMGPFIREVEQAANQARFSTVRADLPDTIRRVLSHMLGFQPLLRLPHKPDIEWMFSDGVSSYAFILVSKPVHVRPGIEAYVKRAHEKVQRGVSRLYVIGRHEEREFVLSVIKSMLAIRELKGVELFSLFRDYRGDDGGVGALLGLDQMLAALHVPSRDPGYLAAPMADEAIVSEVATLDLESSKVELSAHDDLSKIAEDLVVQLSDYEGAWIHLAEFGLALRRQVPEFTPQRYGGRNLLSVLRHLDFLEFDVRGAGPAKVVYVRRRAGTPLSAAVKPLMPIAETGDARTKIIAVAERHGGMDGWIFLGRLGHLLRLEMPEFSHLKMGAASLHELVGRMPEFELQERGEGHAKTFVRVKRQQSTQHQRVTSAPLSTVPKLPT